jgi:hypothetical protein
VSVAHVDQLIVFGFEEALAVEALRQTNNDVEAALQCLLNNRELLEAAVMSRQPLPRGHAVSEPPAPADFMAPAPSSETPSSGLLEQAHSKSQDGGFSGAGDPALELDDEEEPEEQESDDDETMQCRLDEDKLASALLDANGESSFVDDALDLEHELINEWIAKAEAAW